MIAPMILARTGNDEVNAVGVNNSWPSFLAFMEDLASLDAVVLRDRLLHLISTLAPWGHTQMWRPSGPVFLRERRLGGAKKCYRLDAAGIDDTLGR